MTKILGDIKPFVNITLNVFWSALDLFYLRSKPHAQPQKHRRIVTLESPTDNQYNWHQFMTHLRDGVPLVVTGCTESMTGTYDFRYFADVLNGREITVIHILDPEREEQKDARAFFNAIQAGDPETSLFKIKVCLH